MPSVSINSVTYQALGSAFPAGVPAAGVYYSLPPYGKPPYVSARNWDEMIIKFPGVPVVYIKRMGTFVRALHIDLVVVGATLADMEGKRAAVTDSVEQLARYDIVFPGGTTYHGCRLSPGSGIATAEFYPDKSFCSLLSIDFVQLSETN